MGMTTFENQCKILSEWWLIAQEQGFGSDFINFHDLGIPLAFAIRGEYATPTAEGRAIIADTWAAFLDYTDTENDNGWSSLDEMFSRSV